MNRTTVLLPENLKQKANAKAKMLKISLGEFIRKSLEISITNSQTIFKNDPFLNDKKIYSKTKETDLSLNHDNYIY